MATKIGIITDVHGNAPALRAVLAELAREDDLAHVYGAGDLIGIGPDTNEVLELLFGLPAFAGVAGNHEDSILAAVLAREPSSSFPEMEDHHRWVADELDRGFVPRLQALPRVLSPRHGNVELFIAHYHLDAAQELAPIDPEPSPAKLDAQYEAHPAAAILTGHHHDGHFFQTAARLYLNPGALGCGPSPVARYAVLTLGETGMSVERREAAYDRERFLRSYAERDVPHRDFILQRFHS